MTVVFRHTILVIISVVFFSYTVAAQSEDDEDYISPVRPSVSESATIQKKGVLQIEYGGDFDFDTPDYRNEQSGQLGVYFAASKHLRLDFEFETFATQRDRMGIRRTGSGDVNLGFKTLVRDDPKKHLAVAFSYSIKLPAASREKELGTGRIDHNLRLIFDRTSGKNDFVINLSYLNVGREMSNKRDSGAQIVFAYERELPKNFGILSEFSGNMVDEEQPRGIYLNEALTYKINKRLQLDIGARPGFGHAAPRIGIFAGIVAGIGKSKR